MQFISAMILVALLVALGAALSGCGQKGPLVLPPPVAAPQSRPPVERPHPGVPPTSETR